MVDNEDTDLIAAAAGQQPRTLAESTATDGDRRRSPQTRSSTSPSTRLQNSSACLRWDTIAQRT